MANEHRVGYIRVSTVEQNTNRQLDGIELNKVFTDKCSGKDTNRPQLKLMLEFVREGDVAYVHSMDRLARNLDDLRKIVNMLATKKVQITFVKESLTFNGQETPMANFMLSIMGAFAEFERALIKERQKEGVEQAKKQGKYKGRKRVLTQDEVDEINKLISERHKKVDIAKRFGIGRNTLYRYLKTKSPAID